MPALARRAQGLRSWPLRTLHSEPVLVTARTAWEPAPEVARLFCPDRRSSPLPTVLRVPDPITSLQFRAGQASWKTRATILETLSRCCCDISGATDVGRSRNPIWVGAITRLQGRCRTCILGCTIDSSVRGWKTSQGRGLVGSPRPTRNRRISRRKVQSDFGASIRVRTWVFETMARPRRPHRNASEESDARRVASI